MGSENITRCMVCLVEISNEDSCSDAPLSGYKYRISAHDSQVSPNIVKNNQISLTPFRLLIDMFDLQASTIMNLTQNGTAAFCLDCEDTLKRWGSVLDTILTLQKSLNEYFTQVDILRTNIKSIVCSTKEEEEMVEISGELKGLRNKISNSIIGKPVKDCPAGLLQDTGIFAFSNSQSKKSSSFHGQGKISKVSRSDSIVQTQFLTLEGVNSAEYFTTKSEPMNCSRADTTGTNTDEDVSRDGLRNENKSQERPSNSARDANHLKQLSRKSQRKKAEDGDDGTWLRSRRKILNHELITSKGHISGSRSNSVTRDASEDSAIVVSNSESENKVCKPRHSVQPSKKFTTRTEQILTKNTKVPNHSSSQLQKELCRPCKVVIHKIQNEDPRNSPYDKDPQFDSSRIHCFSKDDLYSNDQSGCTEAKLDDNSLLISDFKRNLRQSPKPTNESKLPSNLQERLDNEPTEYTEGVGSNSDFHDNTGLTQHDPDFLLDEIDEPEKREEVKKKRIRDRRRKNPPHEFKFSVKKSEDGRIFVRGVEILQVDGKYKCSICNDFAYAAVDCAVSHLRRKHFHEIDEPKKRGEVVKKKTIRNYRRKNPHHEIKFRMKKSEDGRIFVRGVEILQVDGTYKCSICNDFAYTNIYSAVSHLRRIHFPDIFKWHQCPLCDVKFIFEHMLKIHMQVHTTEKRQMCDICGQTFRTRGTLRGHRRTHNEEFLRRFTCEYCGKQFAWQRDCVVHARTHTQEKPFICEVCAKNFKVRSLLHAHLRKAHGHELSHKCKYCNASFTNISLLHTHLCTHNAFKSHQDQEKEAPDGIQCQEQFEESAAGILSAEAEVGN